MVSSKWFRLSLAFGLGLILLVVSCAPAAEPTVAPTTAPAPPTPTSAPTAPTVAPAATATTAPAIATAIATPRPPTPTPTPAPEQPRRGGTLLTAGTPFGFASWQECCSTYAKLVNDSLLEYVPSNSVSQTDTEIRGRMATEWSISKDGLSWTFKLQPNMKAAIPVKDGGGFEVVDCEDVAWSIMTIKTGEGLTRTMRGRTFVPVTGVDCPDPLTAVIRTKWPYAALPNMVATSINDIKPKTYWQNRLKELPAWLAGSGPWMLERFIAEEIIAMAPNPYYHRNAPDGKPYPYLARVHFQFLSTPACGAALRSGRAHICGGSVGSANIREGADTLYREAPFLKFVGPFRPEDNPVWGSKGLPGISAVFIQVHHQKAPWTNVRMRQAVSLAMDRRTLCDIGYEKWCQPGAWAFYVGSPWNLPREQLENYTGYNINTVEQNLAQARQILTEQGYKLYPDPTALAIDMPGFNPGGACGYLQPLIPEMLRRAGFNPNYYCPELQRSLSQVVAGEFDIVEWDQLVSHPDPNQPCYEHYFTGSDRNYGRYSSAKADDLCNLMGQELDLTKRIGLAQQFHKLVLDEHARATILWEAYSFAYSPDLRGYELSNSISGGSPGRMEKWWLAK